ncbi:hypothetical protein MKW92_033131 [Papaver armeniacum]|nr:hypothetical protein MKW92_033131 [Papaver armeniacum]
MLLLQIKTQPRSLYYLHVSVIIRMFICCLQQTLLKWTSKSCNALSYALPHLEGSKTLQPMSVADVDDASRCSRDPTVSVILGLDDVARVSMLKRCINSFETKSSLCRNDCAWLFALFVVVGIPLNADTTASVRSLLRKCFKGGEVRSW